MWWILLADVVLGVHLAYLAFIPVGGFAGLRWRWVVPVHLVALAVAIASITVHFDCPLTSWEQSLRRRGGQHAYRDGFVDHYLTGHVYPHGYDWAAQLLFGACIVIAYAGLFVHLRHDRALRAVAPTAPARAP